MAGVSELGMTLDELEDTFSFLDDWEDKYGTIIDLGRKLPALEDAFKTDATRVRGCQSQVWLTHTTDDLGRLHFEGDSDALIVKGLVAVMLMIFSAKSPADIVATDARDILERLGLSSHLSPQRANGLFAMVERIKAIAEDS